MKAMFKNVYAWENLRDNVLWRKSGEEPGKLLALASEIEELFLISGSVAFVDDVGSFAYVSPVVF